MIKLVKILFGLIAIFFLFIAIVGFFVAPEGDKTFVYVFFIIGVLSVLFAFKYKGPPNQKGLVKKPTNTDYNRHFQNADVNRIVTQVLETIDITSTTKNIDTLISRLQFLGKVYIELQVAYHTKNYRPQALATLDNYKQLYYNKEITNNQLNAITNPSEFNFDEYVNWAIFNCFVNNFEFQKIEIDKLKTERGKQGRYKKLNENLEQTNNLILYDYKSEFSEIYIERLDHFKSIIEAKLKPL